MGLPPIDEATGYLPPGDWAATLAEIEEVFGGGPRRGEIARALRDAIGRLRAHGVLVIWVDGIDLWPMPSPQQKGRFARPQTIKQFMETDRNGVPKGHILVKEQS